MPQTKALVLLSGGLDSMLAVKLLQEQGIEVAGICFESNFFNADKAKIAAEKLNIDLKIVDIGKEELELVKSPLNGYGKNLNPCLDCHGLMVRKTNEVFKKEGFDVIATGEVSGQRPFSQNRDNLQLVEKLADVEVLRPLSAKILPETIYEKKGFVKRARLLGISGRSRERQMELAKKFGINNYPSPAGGCLLTDPEFSQRLLKMLEYWPDCICDDVELLKYGRIFWLNTEKNEKILVIVGRHEKDNERLEKLAGKWDTILELEEINGPLTLVRNPKLQIPRNKQVTNSKKQKSNILEIEIWEKLKLSELKMGENKRFEEILNIAGLLTGYYSTRARGKKVIVEVKNKKFNN